jgi:hypothetical protein
MARTNRATIEGGPELARAFDRMADRLPNMLRAAGEKSGRRVAEVARGLAPRLSGDLAATIGYEVEDSGETDIYAGSFDVRYAGVQEGGWPARGIPAQPYLAPALEGESEALVNVYDDELDQVIRQWDRDAPR